uniref:Uncharacterized protein n=1 Tax=Rhodopseudomonas palustris (strain BisA53) TaxID=316055 RepID=Q07QI6_RHOP5
MINSTWEQHPYNNIRESDPHRTIALIIGTAPPPRFSNPMCREERELDFQFFYGSEDNYMWVFLEEALEQRKMLLDEMSSGACCQIAREMLERHRLWMCDVLQQYRRKPGRACSASDNDIIPPPDAVFNDFAKVFSERPHLTGLAFTSQLAASWTLQALESQRLIENLGEYRDRLKA